MEDLVRETERVDNIKIYRANSKTIKSVTTFNKFY